MGFYESLVMEKAVRVSIAITSYQSALIISKLILAVTFIFLN